MRLIYIYSNNILISFLSSLYILRYNCNHNTIVIYNHFLKFSWQYRSPAPSDCIVLVTEIMCSYCIKYVHTVPVIYTVPSTLFIHSREPSLLESHGTFSLFVVLETTQGLAGQVGCFFSHWAVSSVDYSFWCCHFCFQTEFGTLWFRLALTLYDPPKCLGTLCPHACLLWNLGLLLMYLSTQKSFVVCLLYAEQFFDTKCTCSSKQNIVDITKQFLVGVTNKQICNMLSKWQVLW